MNLLNAINFIDQTKREDAPTEERIEPTLSEEEVRTRKTRVALNTLLGAIAVAVVALAGYVSLCKGRLLQNESNIQQWNL